MSIALIDVGSNTIRLSVYTVGKEARPGHDFTRVLSKKIMAGLAAYVDDAGMLTQEGVDRACDALGYLCSIVENLHVGETHVFATASLRNIANSAEALASIEGRSGLAIDLVSSEEEALLGYSSFRHDCKARDGVLVDIGGGSTEVTAFRENEVIEATSIPLGSLKLFKKDVGKILPTKKERAKMRKQVERGLDDAGFKRPERSELLCAIGGTARAGCKLVDKLYGRPLSRLGFTRDELADLMGALEDGYTAARELILRTCPDRVHTIIPGLIVLSTVADRFGANRVQVSQYGVREGYLIEHVLCNCPTMHNAR